MQCRVHTYNVWEQQPFWVSSSLSRHTDQFFREDRNNNTLLYRLYDYYSVFVVGTVLCVLCSLLTLCPMCDDVICELNWLDCLLLLLSLSLLSLLSPAKIICCFSLIIWEYMHLSLLVKKSTFCYKTFSVNKQAQHIRVTHTHSPFLSWNKATLDLTTPTLGSY